MAASAKTVLAGEGLLDPEPQRQVLQRALLSLLAGDLAAAGLQYQTSVDTSEPDKKAATVYDAGAYFRWLDGSSVRAERYRAYVRSKGQDAGGSAGNPFVEPVGAVNH